MQCSLKRDHSQKCVHHPLIALDIENDPKTGKFICAALYGYRKDSHNRQHLIDEFFNDQQKLLDRIIEFRDTVNDKTSPFWIVLFNGGYDHPFLEKIIDDSTLFYAGSRFITARIKTRVKRAGKKNKGIKIIDLCNHVDGSLEDWIGYLKMEEKHGIKKESLDDLEVRVKSDTRATYILASFIEDFYISMGISMKLTVGSSALSLYRKRFFKLNFNRDSEFINDYERKAMRGGRVELFKRGNIKVKSYDINSTYLSIMREKEIPDPNTYKYFENPVHWQEHFEKFLGIFHVKVRAEKQRVMCLPYLHPKTKKLIFPCGTFSGYWTSVELKEALKNGYEILECYDYVIYRKSHVMFGAYADYIWGKRKEYKSQGNKGMDLMTKKLGNTLFGKFVQKNRKGGYVGKLEDFDGDLVGRPALNIIDGVEYISVSDNTFEESEHSFPAVGVFITSYARIKLYQMMKKHESSIVYCDTDSVKFESWDISEKDDKELGGWGFEYESEKVFIRPKWYGDKAKGVPKRGQVYSLLEDRSVHAEYDKPNRFRESIRRGLQINKWEHINKELSTNDDKRKWLDDSHSEAWEIIENGE